MKDLAKSRSTCYCGKPVQQDGKMVCCVKCKRWLHAECIKCLDKDFLFGDRFYIVVCSVCNSGSECVARLELTWSELIHLVLYHLSILYHHKYFDLDKSILPFFVANWNKLNLFGSVLNTKKEDRRSKVIEILEGNSLKFKSGKEIKKSKNIWALRIKVPPEAPPVHPSSAKLQNDIVIWEFQVKDRRYHILNKEVSKSNRAPKNGKAKHKLSFSSQSRQKQNKVSKCRGSLPYDENGVHKVKKAKSITVPAFNEESAKIGLLDSLIPYPLDFQHSNNPFQKSKVNSDKKFSDEDQTKASNKRQWNGEIVNNSTVQQNGDSQQSSRTKVPSTSSLRDNLVFDAKEMFSHNSEMAKKYGLRIIGKRITSSGKKQYLFQRNREITETVLPVKKLSQIKILCTCPNCKKVTV